MPLSAIPSVLNPAIAYFLNTQEMHREKIECSTSDIHHLTLTCKEWKIACRPILDHLKAIHAIIAKLKEKPECLSYQLQLADISGWFYRGDYIVLHHNFQNIYSLFHSNCSKNKNIEKEEQTQFLQGTRVIYLDLSVDPFILIRHDWFLDFKTNGITRCNCGLKERVSKRIEIPYAHYINLGYAKNLVYVNGHFCPLEYGFRVCRLR
jgi:hypothetical protein